MKELINLISAFIFSGILFAGAGYTIKQTHEFIKKESLLQTSRGLSSSEELANALTGEKITVSPKLRPIKSKEKSE